MYEFLICNFLIERKEPNLKFKYSLKYYHENISMKEIVWEFNYFTEVDWILTLFA